MRIAARTMALAVALVTVCSCSGADDETKDPMEQYREAMEELLDENYIEAATKFETLANTTLNPVLTQLAMLRLGDALFFQGKYAEAAEVYREFQTQYANSADAPHAGYMRGLCHLRKMPEDAWILPPAESREMEDVRSAYEAFAGVVDRYPGSLYALRSRQSLIECLERRCKHDLYVAQYYEGRDNPKGAVQRLEQAVAVEKEEKRLGRVPQSFACAATGRNLLFLARAAAEAGDAAALDRAEASYRSHMSGFADAEEGLAEIAKLKTGLKP